MDTLEGDKKIILQFFFHGVDKEIIQTIFFIIKCYCFFYFLAKMFIHGINYFLYQNWLRVKYSKLLILARKDRILFNYSLNWKKSFALETIYHCGKPLCHIQINLDCVIPTNPMDSISLASGMATRYGWRWQPGIRICQI